jgi:hypothetical protein
VRPTVFALGALLLTTVTAQERPLPDYNTFAAQVRARLATDEERQSGYVFLERRTEQKLDGAGRPREATVKVFEVYPGLPGEDRYLRLIEEDGRPVPPAKLAEADRARQRKAESYSKKVATPAARQQDARTREKERREYDAALDDLFRIFDIRMIRREAIEGHDTILATLTPRRGVTPLTDDGKVMRHFTARAWISESDYELVRVELEAIDDLSFGLGLLARVHKGTTASYQRRKVNDEIWLPERVTWTASARVLLVRRMRLQGVSEFYNYRKFTVGTSSTYTPVGR